jgi:hypothetical protein
MFRKATLINIFPGFFTNIAAAFFMISLVTKDVQSIEFILNLFYTVLYIVIALKIDELKKYDSK